VASIGNTKDADEMHALIEELKRYEALPPSAIISPKAAAAITGLSERNIRYHPALRRVQTSVGRYGFRKADIEKLCRDGISGGAK
jgi:hypothetical protein